MTRVDTTPASPMQALVSGWRPPRTAATTMAAGMTVGGLLEHRAATRRDHPFVVWEPFVGERRTISYREFADLTRRLAAGLQARGIGPGERVVVHLDNSPEFLLAWFALNRIGAVPVCTNTNSVADELAYFAEHSGAVAAITQPTHAGLLADAAPQLSWCAVTAECGRGDEPSSGAADDPFDSLLGDEADLTEVAVGPWSPSSIQYTSGTTSRPKGVVWSHANSLWGAKVSAAHETLRPDDVHLVHLPLFHTNAQCYSVLASLWVGASVVLQPKFSASRFWDVSLRNRCTWTSVAPFCVRALQSHEVPGEHHYRLWGSGLGAPRSDRDFRVRTIGWWGMTETISHGIVDDPDLPARPFGCGRPAPEYEVLVLDPDGTPVEPDQVGALFVRGTPGLSLFAGYLSDDEATRAAVDGEGWLDTGDLVKVHADGTISFADRAKDLLKVGGENVAASEIELACMAVSGVREVAVVAAPHHMLNEVPIAFVLADGSNPSLADEVLAACIQKLSPFKVPRAVRIVTELPRSTLNKVAKAELRQLLRDEATTNRSDP